MQAHIDSLQVLDSPYLILFRVNHDSAITKTVLLALRNGALFPTV